jgi:hypothetical protein
VDGQGGSSDAYGKLGFALAGDDLHSACKFTSPAISLAASPAKAGAHSSDSATPQGWAPAFAGVANNVRRPEILAKLGRKRPAFRLQFAAERHAPRHDRMAAALWRRGF